MARATFANRRKEGRKAQVKYGKLFTVLCDCNNSMNPTPSIFRVNADDGTCKYCGRRPYLDLRQHCEVIQ